MQRNLGGSVVEDYFLALDEISSFLDVPVLDRGVFLAHGAFQGRKVDFVNLDTHYKKIGFVPEKKVLSRVYYPEGLDFYRVKKE